MQKSAIAIGCLIVFVIVGIAILGLAIGAAGSYNGLNNASQAVDAQWAQVQNVYQRRADLIPNLVNTVKGAADFEKSTLIAVTDARASVGRVTIDANHAPSDAAQLQAFQQAQGQLSNALSRLLMVSENYPQLKANANFQDLQAQLEGTENRIAVERRKFNEVTQTYDTKVKSFPTVLFAGMMGFHEKPYFQAAAGADKAPTVDFNFSGSGSAATPAPAK